MQLSVAVTAHDDETVPAPTTFVTLTRYEVTGPPALIAAVHETFNFAFPATATTPVGAFETGSLGVTTLEVTELALVPTAFVAVTLKV
jgi:hypothetical protein